MHLDMMNLLCLCAMLSSLSCLADCKMNCRDECCMNNLPAKMRDLRIAHSKFRKHYQKHDDLFETTLLDDSLRNMIKTPYGCHVMNDMLTFYLKDVLPKALTKVNNELKSSVETVGSILHDFHVTFTKCKKHFPCSKRMVSVKEIKEQYENMKETGVYKAMHELNLFFFYIEEYLQNKNSN
ncbi:interleukin-10 [Erpetoichthys calabaricus]|uniref:Interleukin family protein n=1 Tax=Erpetoichthys calabaricus TaxID=27687 RepID=A0A8C4RS38_ERPCA|nr:interleukin-10 [Erpetoichthys calabaricus]